MSLDTSINVAGLTARIQSRRDELGGDGNAALAGHEKQAKGSSPYIYQDALRQAQTNSLHADNKRKGHWSWFLIILMLILTTFQCTLLGLVGAKIWDFSQYTWLLPGLLVQNFAQIIGLSLIVVRDLFKNKAYDYIYSKEKDQTFPGNSAPSGQE